MRNCTLKSWFLVVGVLVTLTTAAQADTASWGGGLSLTEKEASSSLGSRIDAVWCGNVLGSWFSSSNQLPQIVCGPVYFAYGDFSGIQRIEKVELSPDHGKTVWKAILVPGKGYCVQLPMLTVGSYAMEWGVASRDKRNRVILLIIPINWNSHRATSMLNHLMVQSAPAGFESFDSQMWFASLRGFVPAQGSLDMGYLQQQKALAQMQPQPTFVQPQPESQPPAPAVSDQEWAQGGSDGQVVTESAEPVMAKKTLVLSGMSRLKIPISLAGSLEIGDKFLFKRDGQLVAQAYVTKISGSVIYARHYRGDIRTGDKIVLEGGDR